MSRLSGPRHLQRRRARVVRWKCLPRSRETSAMRRETTTNRDESPVEVAVSAVILDATQATRLPLQRRGASGFTLQKQRERASAFTLAELLVTIGVLVLLVFFASQLLKSAATVTTLGHKRMDLVSQARQILDRMA